jgi:uncharacterized membrane protein
MSGIAAVTFSQDLEKASSYFNQVKQMSKDHLIVVEAGAVITRDANGKVTVSETWNATNATKWGGFWGLIVGMIFAGPVLGLMIGAGLGKLMGKKKEEHLSKEFINQLSENMKPGDSAIFLAFDNLQRKAVLEQMERMGGSVFADELSPEAEAALAKAMEDEELKRVNVEFMANNEDAVFDELVNRNKTDFNL